MDALETFLRPVTAMVNRQISAKTPARELCQELDGRVFAMRVPGTALAMHLAAEGGTLTLSGEYQDAPDVVVSGSLLSLARLAGPAGEALIRDGDVDIAGDAVTAQRFQKLLRYGQPDLEEELSGVIGDVAAHNVGEMLRGIGRFTQHARDTLRQNLGEYLQEESRAVPGRYEVDAFKENVNSLRDDVARFEARLRKLEQSPG